MRPNLFILYSLLLAVAVHPAQSQSYKPAGPIRMGGVGVGDYLTADAVKRRLYVSHGAVVEVIDLDSQKPIGQIGGLSGIHGITIADDLGVGFISDGRANQVVQ